MAVSDQKAPYQSQLLFNDDTTLTIYLVKAKLLSSEYRKSKAYRETDG